MVKSQTIWTGDNLPILRGLDSETFDLIYLDPPFNSNRRYSAPLENGERVGFKDVWAMDDTRAEWHGEIADKEPAIYHAIAASEHTHGMPMKAYLLYMAIRLIELKRILKPNGSVYLHCDPTAGHYLKMLMDAIFGAENFQNEIIWERTKGAKGTKGKAKAFPRNSDSILFYAPPNAQFNPQYRQLEGGGLAPYRHAEKDGRLYMLDNVSNPGGNGYKYDLGKDEKQPAGGYRMPKETALKWLKEGQLVVEAGKVPRRKRYLDESMGAIVPNIWTDIGALQGSSKEKLSFQTQKPLALLERIIAASSVENDFVLDPFCGCATTLIAAERLERRWVGIDISPQAVNLVKKRMQSEPKKLLEQFNPIHRTDIPKRTDILPIAEQKERDKNELYGRQNGNCNGCRFHFPFRNMTIDHIKPISLGGSDDISNKQLLCGACNSTKGKGTHGELISKLKEQKII